MITIFHPEEYLHHVPEFELRPYNIFFAMGHDIAGYSWAGLEISFGAEVLTVMKHSHYCLH
jgi:hypothetical protein